MGRRAKPNKVKAEAKRPLARESPKADAPRVPELEARLADALEERVALSEILRVISQSPTDAQPVFDYGPKADFVIRSVTGKEFAASTNQLDLYMPHRFGLTYIDSGGRDQHVVVLHRAPLGSHERFVGFLIEHFAGAFPVWLSPTQPASSP